MSEIDRRARKLCEDRVYKGYNAETRERLLQLQMPNARRDVLAVLLAMREPTQAQYDALCATDKMWREQTSRTVWTTYIDAYLNEGGV